MQHRAAVDTLAAMRQRIAGILTWQGGNPRPGIGGPALHGVGGGADVDLAGLPHRIGRGGARDERSGDTVAHATGPPRPAGGGGECGPH